MTPIKLQIIPTELLPTYLEQVSNNILKTFNTLQEAEISTTTFSFYTSVASVYSSKIEGENIELDSYIKHKKFGVEFLPDYTKKIDDLYNAYLFAKDSSLNKNNTAEAHRLLSKNLISNHQQGKYRTQNMYVTTSDGRIEYVAAPPIVVETEMNKFYEDLKDLITLGKVLNKRHGLFQTGWFD